MRIIRLVGPVQRAYAKSQIDEAPDGYVVQIGAESRTLAQNRKMWPMLTDIRQQVDGMQEYQQEDIKLRFLNALGVEMRFLPALEGEGIFPVGLRSSTLTKDQFSGLIELLYEFGARKGVRWTDPKDQALAREYEERMKR